MRKKWFGIAFLLLPFIVVACLEDISTGSGNENPVLRLAEISVEPLSILPGDSSVVTVSVANGDLATLNITYDATGGTIAGSGAQAIFTADTIEGQAWVMVTLNDSQGNVISGSANIHVTNTIPLVAIGVQLLDSGTSGGKCMVFTAVPSENLIFLRVLVTNPIDEEIEISGNPAVPVLANNRFSIQLAGQCFSFHSGTYSFDFTLQRNLNEASFTLNATYVQP